MQTYWCRFHYIEIARLLHELDLFERYLFACLILRLLNKTESRLLLKN
jgi:hypothetical protein